MRIRNDVWCILSNPLMRTSRTFSKLPFKAKQVFEITIAPLGWRFRPGYFKPAGDSVSTLTGTKIVVPAQALHFHAGRFRFLPYMGGRRSAMGFAKGMAACYEGNCFFIVHGHAAKSISDVFSRNNGVGV